MSKDAPFATGTCYKAPTWRQEGQKAQHCCGSILHDVRALLKTSAYFSKPPKGYMEEVFAYLSARQQILSFNFFLAREAESRWANRLFRILVRRVACTCAEVKTVLQREFLLRFTCNLAGTSSNMLEGIQSLAKHLVSAADNSGNCLRKGAALEREQL